MESLDLDDVICKILETKDSCTCREVYNWVRKYCKTHEDVYIEADDDTMCYYMDAYPDHYWWDSFNQVFRKQEIFYCPFCNDKHRKYPQVEKFMKLKALTDGKSG